MDSTNSNKVSNLKNHVGLLQQLVVTLTEAKSNALIGEAEAKLILNDFLKATGIKQIPTQKVVTPASDKTATEMAKSK